MATFLSILVVLFIVLLSWVIGKSLLEAKRFKLDRIEFLSQTLGCSKQVESIKEFVQSFVNEYIGFIEDGANAKFHKQLRFNKGYTFSAKVVLSSYKDVILYIYPSSKSILYVDCLNIPAQLAFLSGIVDFKKAENPANTEMFTLSLPYEHLLREYDLVSAAFGTDGTGIRIFGHGKINLESMVKIGNSQDNVLFGFYNNAIEVNNSGENFTKAFGRPVSFSMELEGPFFVGQKVEFSPDVQNAKSLAMQVASDDIANLLVDSEFFRMSLAHEKLRKMAEAIASKKNRSENDTTFKYPLWELKVEALELEKTAKEAGIVTSYVSELLELSDEKVQAQTGSFFGYYPTTGAFMWTWVATNCLFMLILLIVQLMLEYNYSGWPSIQSFMKIVKVWFTLPSLIVLVNGYAFSNVPKAFTRTQFALAIVVGILTFIWAAVLTWKIESPE
jgi:hypothetical protein